METDVKTLKVLLLLTFMPEFVQALTQQLCSDNERYGPTWRKRNVGNQELRIFMKFREYWDQYVNAEVPIPWLKIAGLALIAWVRLNHPEVLIDNKDDVMDID